LSYRYKNERSVAFKIRQNPFSAGQGSAPDPAGGAHDAPPEPLVGWRGDTPPHIPPHSARTHLRRSPGLPREVQPDLRLWLRARKFNAMWAHSAAKGWRTQVCAFFSASLCSLPWSTVHISGNDVEREIFALMLTHARLLAAENAAVSQ